MQLYILAGNRYGKLSHGKKHLWCKVSGIRGLVAHAAVPLVYSGLLSYLKLCIGMTFVIASSC